jgi:hypothetical protein
MKEIDGVMTKVKPDKKIIKSPRKKQSDGPNLKSENSD